MTRLQRDIMVMMTMTNDTHPEAERTLDEIFRSIGPRGRMLLWNHFTQDHLARTREYLVNLFPNATPAELKLKFVQALYGEELAKSLRVGLDGWDQGAPESIQWQFSDPGFARAKTEVEASKAAHQRLAARRPTEMGGGIGPWQSSGSRIP